MTDKELARKIIEIIDAYESCDSNPIKTIEVYCQQVIEKQEQVSKDLVEAAIIAADEDMQGRQIMEESNENRQLYSRIFRRGFKAGAQWQKEQMMVKAVDGVVTFDYYDSGDKTYGCIAHDSFCLEDLGLKDTDKVKVIVIKED